MTASTTGGTDPADGSTPVAALSYAAASAELDAVIEEFEAGIVDVDRLVARLERATAIVDELDHRLRRTRMQVEELVPRLEAIGREEGDADPSGEDEAGGGHADAPDAPAGPALASDEWPEGDVEPGEDGAPMAGGDAEEERGPQGLF